jgi:SAM-dependent methyltransferase
MTLASETLLEGLDAAACTRLRERLAAAGYDSAFVGAAEDVAPQMVDRLRMPLIRWWLSSRPGAAADLASIFCYGLDVARERVVAALGADLVARLGEAGVLVPAEAATVRSPYLLLPLEGQWFLSDRLDAGGEAVMGPGMTTLLLHRLLAELPGERVLDLGCGAASLAIAAAKRGARATGADLSERALAIAAFNARLNAVTIEIRLGDVGEAVRGETFDLVLAQPPYVPRPEGESGTTYLHGGRFGDELAMRFVAASARLLTPGGVAVVHFDSVVRPNDPLPARLREATGDAPVELLGLVGRGPSLDQHSILYAGGDHPGLGEDFARAAVANRAHLEALGVTEIARVIVVLRRPRTGEAPGGRYRIVLQVPSLNQLRPGAVAEMLAALDLASSSDEALLAARVVPHAGATFVGEWPTPAAEAPARLKITFPSGSLAQDRELGDRGWLLFGLLDGSRTVGEAIPTFAAECEAAPPEARAEVLGFVREGLARGLLRPKPAGSPSET